MTTFYLRVEGVNLSNFVFDTQDLSTIRGGSLLLLDAIDKIKTECPTLQPVSTGASSGLFGFECNGADEAKTMLNRVRNILDNGALKHTTFVADIIPASAEFASDRKRLLALNRWQQMQAPSVAIPAEVASDPTRAVCEVDKVRPALEQEGRARDRRISRSVAVRQQYGVKEKHRFYARELLRLGDSKVNALVQGLNFTNDLNEISECPDVGNLNGKIALIYLDGNRFGSIQSKCKTVDDLAKFDTNIKHYRCQMLADLLGQFANDPLWFNDKKLRFETLLWGGDEIVWVVPAWKGWQTLTSFFECSRDWKWGNEQLTHATGLVFCHHNAPIHRIKELAYNLAGICKESGRGRERSLVAYMVLESFDHAGSDIAGYVQRRYSRAVSAENLIIPGETMAQWSTQMRMIKGGLPRRRVFPVVHALADGTWPGKAEAARIGLEQGVASALDTINTLCGDPPGPTPWLHLAELWDYMGLD